MPAPSRPPEPPRRYDRWTFDQWEAQKRRLRREVRRRRFRLLSCAGAVLLAGVAAWTCGRPRLARTARPVAAVRPLPPGALAGVTVILDPGHGGEDPGASLHWGRNDVHEAALTYRTAMELADTLRAAGADVRYTVRSRMLDPRLELSPLPPALPDDAALVSTDRPLRARVRRSPRQLWQRADLARQVWAQAIRRDPRAARDVFFLSLHFDDAGRASVRGGLVCVDRRAGPPPAFALDIARALAAHGWARGEQSFGQDGMSANDLGVLNPAYNPVPQKALLELATLSNMDDYLRATDPVWRAQVAQIIAQSIADAHRG